MSGFACALAVFGVLQRMTMLLLQRNGEHAILHFLPKQLLAVGLVTTLVQQHVFGSFDGEKTIL